MQQIRMTNQEFIYYGAIAGGILGLFIGIILLILGLVKKERRYGVFGFLSSLILGPISGILSIIVGIVFTWLIFRNSNKKKLSTSNQVSDSENLIENNSASNSDSSSNF